MVLYDCGIWHRRNGCDGSRENSKSNVGRLGKSESVMPPGNERMSPKRGPFWKEMSSEPTIYFWGMLVFRGVFQSIPWFQICKRESWPTSDCKVNTISKSRRQKLRTFWESLFVQVDVWKMLMICTHEMHESNLFSSFPGKLMYVPW